MACSQIIQTVETKGGASNLEEATHSSPTNNGQPQVHMWLFLMRLNVDLSEVYGRCRYHACDIGSESTLTSPTSWAIFARLLFCYSPASQQQPRGCFVYKARSLTIFDHHRHLPANSGTLPLMMFTLFFRISDGGSEELKHRASSKTVTACSHFVHSS